MKFDIKKYFKTKKESNFKKIDFRTKFRAVRNK